MVSRFVGGRDLWTRGERTQRKPVGNALGSDQNVWDDAIMLNGEHLSSAAKARLDFVGYEQNLVLVKDLLDLAKVIGWRNNDAAFPHHRLSNKRGNITGGLETDYVFETLRTMPTPFLRIIGPQRTVCIGRRRKRNARGIRPAT